MVSGFKFQVLGLTSSITPRTPSSDYAFPQGLLLHVITSRFGLIQVSFSRPMTFVKAAEPITGL